MKHLSAWEGQILTLKFRCLLLSDARWLTENANDPQAAKYAIDVFPMAGHEIEEWLKRDFEEKSSRYIVAELDGEPAGFVRLSFRSELRRDRHVVWLGIAVRRAHFDLLQVHGLLRNAFTFLLS
ncbi:GNAT family N-acetyltransferase [Candidatus Bathyarchaeota archaeon]|nr:GNAT family N-acetyltransferase [Candidatus Bathyarchaeota archaeon]